MKIIQSERPSTKTKPTNRQITTVNSQLDMEANRPTNQQQEANKRLP
jgi:hypothetical protein